MRTRSFDNFLNEKLKDKEFRILYEEARMHLRIAHLVEKLRLDAGLTQKELAAKAGVSQPLIARLEQGDQHRVPTLSTINNILSVLGYEVDLVIKKAA